MTEKTEDKTGIKPIPIGSWRFQFKSYAKYTKKKEVIKKTDEKK